MDTYDVIVLGAGSAAREAATRASVEHGASVAIVERERWGGQCPNVACKPTKQYVSAAELLRDLAAVAADLGIDTGPASFDLGRLKERKDWLIGTSETWRQRFVDSGYEVIDGEASFADAHTVRVGDRTLTSERILIATGSRTAKPPIDGLDGVPWIDHIAALELTELPESLLVLGGGPVGLELAQAFARFGSRVTIVQSADRISPRSDADATAEVTLALEDDGVDVVTSTFVTAVERDGAHVVATLTPCRTARHRGRCARRRSCSPPAACRTSRRSSSSRPASRTTAAGSRSTTGCGRACRASGPPATAPRRSS